MDRFGIAAATGVARAGSGSDAKSKRSLARCRSDDFLDFFDFFAIDAPQSSRPLRAYLHSGLGVSASSVVHGRPVKVLSAIE
jgi:hypothetical protein